MLETKATHPATGNAGGRGRRRRGDQVRCLIATDEQSLAEAQALIATLPLCATGRVFVEVADESMIGAIPTPPRMTVTWLPRHRSGDRRPVQPRGRALAAAVRGWSSEMLCDGGSVHAWLRGDYRGVAAIHEYLTEQAGVDDGAIDRPEHFALGGHATR